MSLLLPFSVYMKPARTLCCLSATLFTGQQPAARINTSDERIMIAAVSRDDSVLAGGIGSGSMLAPGKLKVEPIATFNATGEWISIPCSSDRQSGCSRFERTYLKRPHTYSIISAVGYGAHIQAAATTLDECYGYMGNGKYSGATIAKSAVAASSTEFFSAAPNLNALSAKDAATVRRQLAAFVPSKLDSIDHLQMFQVRMEGQDVILIQRTFANQPSIEGAPRFVFTLGTLDGTSFHASIWNKEVEDHSEQVVGTMHLKTGRDFLVTTVSDPESQTFRVYGIRDGRVVLVYKGGGSSC